MVIKKSPKFVERYRREKRLKRTRESRGLYFTHHTPTFSLTDSQLWQLAEKFYTSVLYEIMYFNKANYAVFTTFNRSIAGKSFFRRLAV